MRSLELKLAVAALRMALDQRHPAASTANLESQNNP
jgi:hypothetical protein